MKILLMKINLHKWYPFQSHKRGKFKKTYLRSLKRVYFKIIQQKAERVIIMKREVK